MSDAVMIELDREDVERHFRVRGGRGTRAVDKALRAALDTPAPEQSQVSPGLSDDDRERILEIAHGLSDEDNCEFLEQVVEVSRLAEHPPKGDQLWEWLLGDEARDVLATGLIRFHDGYPVDEAGMPHSAWGKPMTATRSHAEDAARKSLDLLLATLTEASADPEGDGR